MHSARSPTGHGTGSCWPWECLGLKDRDGLGKAEASLGMEHVNPLPPNYNFEIRGFSGKDMRVGIAVLYQCV